MRLGLKASLIFTLGFHEIKKVRVLTQKMIRIAKKFGNNGQNNKKTFSEQNTYFTN